MKYTYEITGMTCSSCEDTVKKLLSSVDGIKNVNADKSLAQVEIDSDQEIAVQKLNGAFVMNPKYSITKRKIELAPVFEEQKKPWYVIYKPLLTVFIYILMVSTFVSVQNEENFMGWMNYFMGGFFIAFSFFKFLNLKGFAESYAMYDVIAMKWKGWAYLYAFIELGLGLAFIIGFEPLLVNLITFFVMSVSLIGVVKSIMDKKKIKCACLGDVFNLPMSSITIIEDGLMIAMSLIMVMLIF